MNDERAQTIKKGNRTAELASKPLAKKLKHWAVTSSFLWVCHISQCLPDSSNTALHTLVSLPGTALRHSKFTKSLVSVLWHTQQQRQRILYAKFLYLCFAKPLFSFQGTRGSSCKGLGSCHPRETSGLSFHLPGMLAHSTYLSTCQPSYLSD